MLHCHLPSIVLHCHLPSTLSVNHKKDKKKTQRKVYIQTCLIYLLPNLNELLTKEHKSNFKFLCNYLI